MNCNSAFSETAIDATIEAVYDALRMLATAQSPWSRLELRE